MDMVVFTGGKDATLIKLLSLSSFSLFLSPLLPDRVDGEPLEGRAARLEELAQEAKVRVDKELELRVRLLQQRVERLRPNLRHTGG